MTRKRTGVSNSLLRRPGSSVRCQLTLSVGHLWQAVDGNGARLQHLVLELLLLELLQLVFELRLVEWRADVDAAHRLGDLLVEPVVLLEFVPARVVSTSVIASRPPDNTYIVSSTLVGVSLPWICFMASPARCIAKKVSWLIFADSIAFICCSMVPMWFSVCSRLCSWIFLRRSAALAAIKGQPSVLLSQEGFPDKGCHTGLVCGDVLLGHLLLLLYLAREVDFALLQHLQLRPQVEDHILGRIFPLLRGATAEPAPDS